MNTATTADTTTDTMSVATRLVELCRERKHLEAIDELYHRDVVSVEAVSAPGEARETRGHANVRAKTEWWLDAHELHSDTIEGPFPHGDDRFALVTTCEMSAKEGPHAGARTTMHEVGVYTIDDGRIVREEYFYANPGGC
ncbi:MAG: nuclear transport factor 2 family protein [Planctomycetota bacterium]